MEGGREVGFLRPIGSSVREQAARMTLNNVRKQGHTCVELREDGKRLIFFCALCLSPCYSDTVLFDHLRGNIHTRRNTVAKATLFGSNPWPFNDGFHFFDTLNENENENQSGNSNGSPLSLLDASENTSSLALVNYSGSTAGGNMVVSGNRDLSVDGGDCDMLIPGVLIKEEISNLKLTYVGTGQIGARILEKNGDSKGMSRIWCEWFGKKDIADEDIFNVPQHGFGVVVFSYTYEMGRQSLFTDVKLLASSKHIGKQGGVERPKKKRKCYSAPEDTNELRSLYDSSWGYSLTALSTSSPRLLLDQNGDVGLISSSKTVRRELRRKQRVAAERACDICQHKMLPGKDVAALLNMKTERLACNRRNEYGAFHMYHTSCLVHWILFCEYEIYRNQLFTEQLFKPEAKVGSKKKKSRAKGSCKGMGSDSTKSKGKQICCVFCPQCQGTADVEGDDLEKPTITLSEMFNHKIRLSDAHSAWMTSPEVSQNCSTGLTFPSESKDAIEETVIPLKLLHFYRALMNEIPNGVN